MQILKHISVRGLFGISRPGNFNHPSKLRNRTIFIRMPSKNWDEEKLIRAIRGKEQEREAALKFIYQNQEWKRIAERFVLQNSGNSFDAEDVFQEAIIQLDKNIRKGKFEGRSALQTYFVAIAKFTWLKKLQRSRPTDEIQSQHFDEIEESPEIRFMTEEKAGYLRKAMALFGERCKKIFKLYILSYSMEEIAQAIGLSSPAMAKKESYRCRVRLKEFFDENPEWKALVN